MSPARGTQALTVERPPLPQRRARRLFGAFLAVATSVALIALAGCATPQTPGAAPCAFSDKNLIIPADGALYGVNLDWAAETLAQYQSSLGHTPAVAAKFATLPYDKQEWEWIVAAAEQTRTVGGILLLTLEPQQGLAAVDDSVADRLGADLRTLNELGTPVVLRFAHEMNGSWYSWSQQPSTYITTFRRVAAAVHQQAPGTAMLWAPNYGGGYPFAGGAFTAKPKSADFIALDTNKDGVVNMKDDPYLPYYPGDDAVDWVGMSLYHWGNRYPWGRNDIPEPDKFVQLLTGTYHGSIGDERAVPDFYQVFGVQHQRPVAVTETAAFYRPSGTGASQLEIKQAWWRQVFADQTHQRFPMLKMINWFEWKKQEVEVKGVVDWRAVGETSIRTAFVADLPSWLVYGKPVVGCPA